MNAISVTTLRLLKKGDTVNACLAEGLTTSKLKLFRGHTGSLKRSTRGFAFFPDGEPPQSGNAVFIPFGREEIFCAPSHYHYPV